MNEFLQESIETEKTSDLLSMDARTVQANNVSGMINQIFNKSNMLLNSLKDFTDKYNSDDRQILSNKKFLLTFNELMSIIKEAIETQVKIYETDTSHIEKLKNLSQEFINNLSYNIFSLEKIETESKKTINNQIKNTPISTKTKNKYNNEITSPRFIKNNKTIDFVKQNLNSSNRKQQTKKFFMNKPNITNMTKSKKELIKKPNIIKNEKKLSNLRLDKSKKSFNTCNKSADNKKPMKEVAESYTSKKIKNKSNKSNKENNNNSYSKINFSTISGMLTRIGTSRQRMKFFKRNSNKRNNKEGEPLYKSTEDIKNRGVLKTNKIRSVVRFKEDEIVTDSNDEGLSNNNNIAKKDEKSFDNDLYSTKIVNKKVVDKVRRPSTLSNQILQMGIKCINEFNGLKNEEEKRVHNK